MAVFLGIGSLSESERGILFRVFIGEIGAAVIALFYSIFGLKRAKNTEDEQSESERRAFVKEDKSSEHLARSRVLEQIVIAGITNFFPSREHYALYRPNAVSIDRYVNTAQKTLVMVSINLMTGLPFDGLCRTLERRLENRSKPISVTISLLNPWRNELMVAMGPVLETQPSQLVQQIKGTLRELFKLKNRLSPEAQDRFAIRIHNAIPFGSAIMIDHRENYGRIQIETKPYKAPLKMSFAFEVLPTEPDGFFYTLSRAYEALSADGDPVDSSIL
ncbi:MAG: hypothetical protein KAV87_28435 [Desulfobacteraceae bacterium]|nr:hypothetical protein [Desulfobacteraceae bacterium]